MHVSGIRPFKVDCLFCIQKDSSLYAGAWKTKHGLKLHLSPPSGALRTIRGICSVCFCLGHNKSYMLYTHGDTKQTINFKRPNEIY